MLVNSEYWLSLSVVNTIMGIPVQGWLGHHECFLVNRWWWRRWIHQLTMSVLVAGKEILGIKQSKFSMHEDTHLLKIQQDTQVAIRATTPIIAANMTSQTPEECIQLLAVTILLARHGSMAATE